MPTGGVIRDEPPAGGVAPRLRVCVGIPIFRATLTANERIALTQCVRVLGRHPLVLMKSESLDVAALLAEFPQLAVETFPERFFQGSRGFNTLLLSPEFYDRFQGYEYLLIHRLDAFVFEDRLADWCARGFDYIGAPWVKDRMFRSRSAERRYRFRSALYEWLDRRAPDGVAPHPDRLLFRTGAGGLSLRRTRAFRDVLAALGQRAATFAAGDPPADEDQFFGIEVNHRRTALRTPDFDTALQFSVGPCPRYCVQRLGGALPFGCQGWDKFDVDYWATVLARFGHVVDTASGTPDCYVGARPELVPYIPAIHGRVLEIGCGRGGFRKHLHPQAEVWGIEPNAAAAGVAVGALHRVIVGTYESARVLLPDRYFDLVICNDVIEHMPNDAAFLRDIQSKMTPTGQLVGSIPNMRYWPVLKALVVDKEWEYKDQGVLDRTHLRFYTVRSFPRLLKAAGFEVARFEGINRDLRGLTRFWLHLLGPQRFSDVGYVQFAFVARPGPG